jgi:hypothetical protein
MLGRVTRQRAGFHRYVGPLGNRQQLVEILERFVKRFAADERHVIHLAQQFLVAQWNFKLRVKHQYM